MRMKSFAFGTLELIGEITDLSVKDDWLIMNIKTTTPAGWTLKAALTHADLWRMIKLMCTWSNFCYTLFGFGKPKDTNHIPEF